MRVLDIAAGTIVDGPGLRTSIYFAGCDHRCPGCHNPQSWAFDGGNEISIDQLMAEIEENDFDVTLTGGDPLYQIDEILPLCQRIHDLGKNIWLYTGYTVEQIMADPSLRRIIKAVDVIVDGPFILAQRDISLQFRGSGNQRIIHTADYVGQTD
ncbi:MAG: anaerobic ribonucleoside-triphosphate reductase activating protein [Bacteroidales bacterium]|nr:anaerobic ribonucleoside-triphosphate reductase activating protein [Bacteroidales bacterium]